MTKLTQKNSKFEWSGEHEQSFEILKQKLATPPILVLPIKGKDFTIYNDSSKWGTEGKGFTLYNDASNEGLNGVLMQEERVIAYA